jgi:hypothetical protein
MRVLILGYRGNPYCGGQGIYIYNLSRELALLGVDVDVMVGPPTLILLRIGPEYTKLKTSTCGPLIPGKSPMKNSTESSLPGILSITS